MSYKYTKVQINSFGCQMNKLDTALLTEALQRAGKVIVEDSDDAEIIIFNTCSVREHAEQKVLSRLGFVKHLKEQGRAIITAVVGCMAQRLAENLLDHPAVDIVVGPSQIYMLPQILEETINDGKKRILVSDKIRSVPEFDEVRQLDNFESEAGCPPSAFPGQAFIRAMRGCNQFCTYCIVPYVRGPEVSRNPHEIVEQAKRLADKGVMQVTLLGQTINSYNYTAGERTYRLADLLEMVTDVQGIKWVRFITSHPGQFDESILRAMANIEKVCPYLHIPAQSGSDSILKTMNRGYTAAQYISLMDRAKEIVADIAIAGDFIVGFPGESEKDFKDTVKLVRHVRYKNCFVFKYSPRPGTRADSKLADSIGDDIKKERNIRLLDEVNRISEEDNKRFIGRTLEVFVEGPSKKPHLNDAGSQDVGDQKRIQLTSRTSHDYIVVFEGPEELTGQFTEVRITGTSPLTLFGQL